MGPVRLAVGSVDGQWKDQVLRRMDVWLDRRMAGCLKYRDSVGKQSSELWRNQGAPRHMGGEGGAITKKTQLLPCPPPHASTRGSHGPASAMPTTQIIRGAGWWELRKEVKFLGAVSFIHGRRDTVWHVWGIPEHCLAHLGYT